MLTNGEAMRKLRAERSGSEDIPVCRHWAKKGVCLFAASCGFGHNPEDRGSLVAEETAHRERARGKFKRNRIYNEGRAACLRRWCIRTFGLEHMASGTGVLDVAGGKGELGFELLALNGIQTTVVDPRVMNTNRYQRKLEFDYYHKNAVLNKYNTAVRPAANTLIQPLHIRGMFQLPARPLYGQETLLCEPCQPEGETTLFPLLLRDRTVFDDSLEEARQLAWTNKGLNNEEDGDRAGVLGTDRDRESEKTWGTGDDDGRFIPGIEVGDFDEAKRLVAGASIVVGMHPDQGAEPLVDFALTNGKPFAVVPCCVYGKDFPKRKAMDGSAVRCYGEFIEFLLAKDPNIQTAELDFEGKNILLYHLGGRVPLKAPEEAELHVVRGPSDQTHWWSLSTRKKEDKSSRRAVARQRLGETGAGVMSNGRKTIQAMSWFDAGGGAGATATATRADGGADGGADGVAGVENVFGSLFLSE